MKEIPLSTSPHSKYNGMYVVLVDDDDYAELSKYNWTADVGDYSVYAKRAIYPNGKQQVIMMHRQIMNTPKGFDTDHVDGNGLNNQKHNLRVCTRPQNVANRRQKKNGSSIYRGVFKRIVRGKPRFEVYMSKGMRLIYGGVFKNEVDAAKRYNELALKYHGEFAVLNQVA